MPSVTNILGALEQLESADIVVHQNRCVAVRNRNATCMKCAEVCTSGCISYKEGQLVIALENCIGCGTCATSCPTCALEARKPNDAELLRQCLLASKAADGEVIIVCDQMLAAAQGLFDASKVVGVACLGRIEESLLVALATAGVKRVSLVQAACSDCAYVVGLETTQLVCDTTRSLLDTWNSELVVRLSEKLPAVVRLSDAKECDEGRREFFSSMKDEAKTAAIVAADHVAKDALGVADVAEPRFLKVMSDGTLPHFVPDRRERLLDSLAALGEPRDEMIATRLWGHVVVDIALCTSCRMCATFCPTGAIVKFDEEDGTIGIDHYPADCVKCCCCTDICPSDALWISDEVFAVDLLSGAVDRTTMPPLKNPPSGPHSMWHSMKDLMGIEQVYER